jgi:hypothetical protein
MGKLSSSALLTAMPRVWAYVRFDFDTLSAAGARCGDGIDDGLMAGEWLDAAVHRDAVK